MGTTAYDKSMELFKYIHNNDNVDSDKVARMWNATFNCVLKEMGLPKKARRFLWDNLVRGNWRRLYLMDDEVKRTPKEWLEDFHWDVFYCSDRWSFDRLTRCHWMYRAWSGAYTEVEHGGYRGSYTCEADETEIIIHYDEYGHDSVRVHCLECSECGRTYEHVNGSYDYCPHCGRKVTKVHTLS